MAAKPIFVQAVDTNGTPYSGAKLNVYDAGTTTPRAIYTESGLGTASANPAIADANGVVVVWVNDAGGDIKVTLTNSAETVTPHNEDNVPIASLTCYPVITFQGDQSLLTTSSPTFAGLTLGNVSFAGVVADPNADRLIFWDDSAGQVNFMTLGTGLAFNGTALELDGDLQDISGLTPTNGGVIIGDGTDFVVESGATLRTSIGLGTGDSVTFAGLTLASGATVTAILDEDNLVSDSATAVPTQQSVKAYADSLADTIADINAITQADGTIIVSDGSNWVGEAGATARASIGATVGYAANFSALKALTGGEYDIVHVDGHSSSGDGGGGVFRWDASSTTADDNGVYIQPNAGGAGRWIRQYNGGVHVDWYGATGDETTNDIAAFNAAAAALGTPGGSVLVSAKKRYYLGNDFLVPRNVTLLADAPMIRDQDETKAIAYDAFWGGVLFMSSGSEVRLSGDGAAVQNLGILASNLRGYTIPATDAAAYALVEAFAGTAITCGATGNSVDGCIVLGFDTAVSQTGNRSHISRVKFDCHNGILIDGQGSDVSRVEHCHGWPYLTSELSLSSDVNSRFGRAYRLKGNSDKFTFHNCYCYGALVGFEVYGPDTSNTTNQDALTGCRADSGNIQIDRAITSISDSAGSPGSQIVVALDGPIAGEVGDFVTITGTSSYNATKTEILAKASSTSIEVSGAFGSTETGVCSPYTIGIWVHGYATNIDLISCGAQNYHEGLWVDTQGIGGANEYRSRVKCIGGDYLQANRYNVHVTDGYLDIQSRIALQTARTVTGFTSTNSIGIRWANGSDGGSFSCHFDQYGINASDGALVQFATGTVDASVSRAFNSQGANVDSSNAFVDNYFSEDVKIESGSIDGTAIGASTASSGAFTKISTSRGTELTISSGAITASSSYHPVDTESDAATDDLDTINGGIDGMRLILRAASSSRTVVLKDGTGNLYLSSDISLDSAQDTIELMYDTSIGGGGWLEVGNANNAA